MGNQGRAGIEAFIDKGFPAGNLFCTQFLYSPEFNSNTLRTLAKDGKNQSKYDLAASLANGLETKTLDSNEVLLAFVQQSRKWLSLKLGYCDKPPTSKPASLLLTELGEEGWYGPIADISSPRRWYIRTHKIPFYEQVYKAEGASAFEIAEQVKSVASHSIRWTVVAELGTNYIALSWNGFRHNELAPGLIDPHIESLMQFPYWLHIPKFFKELEKEPFNQLDVFASTSHKTSNDIWQHPVLHQVVLQNLWDKFLGNSQYVWRHLRIRADNRGVALNAHSTGAFDQETQQMRGLQALSRQLANSALKSLNIQETSETISLVENALLRTLIQEWGIKSYEFSLDKVNNSNGKSEKLFRAHCYFANGSSSSPQDSLQHLRCFTGDYGGSTQALKFLLSELKC